MACSDSSSTSVRDSICILFLFLVVKVCVHRIQWRRRSSEHGSLIINSNDCPCSRDSPFVYLVFCLLPAVYSEDLFEVFFVLFLVFSGYSLYSLCSSLRMTDRPTCSTEAPGTRTRRSVSLYAYVYTLYVQWGQEDVWSSHWHKY